MIISSLIKYKASGIEGLGWRSAVKKVKAAGLILLLATLSLSCMARTCNAAPHAARSSTTHTYNVQIPDLSDFVISGEYPARMILFGSFYVTAGGLRDIDFLIFNSTNYENYTNGQPANASLEDLRDSSYDWIFQVPYLDTWYVVFSNEFSLIISKNVTIFFGNGTGPFVTISNPIADGEVNETVESSVAINASAISEFPIANISISIDNKSIVTEYNTSAISYPWDAKPWSDGYHMITVTATDKFGNSNNASIRVWVLQPTPPTTQPPNTTQPPPSSSSSSIPVGTLLGLGSIIFVFVLLVIAVSRIRRSERQPSDIVSRSTRKVEIPAKKTVVEAQSGFCPHCGTKTIAGETFCRNCGAYLGG
jgi:hypothetical protein